MKTKRYLVGMHYFYTFLVIKNQLAIFNNETKEREKLKGEDFVDLSLSFDKIWQLWQDYFVYDGKSEVDFSYLAFNNESIKDAKALQESCPFKQSDTCNFKFSNLSCIVLDEELFKNFKIILENNETKSFKVTKNKLQQVGDDFKDLSSLFVFKHNQNFWDKQDTENDNKEHRVKVKRSLTDLLFEVAKEEIY